jgi:tRNA threonylcarbamoyl adenosine modification protein (Sua5/YciO/YrdC/YwlC family)
MLSRKRWRFRLKRRQKKLKISDKTIKIDPVKPEPELVQKAASVIRSGGIVVFPTRCIYGLAADALNEAAVDRIYEIKGRESNKPILVLAHNYLMLSCLVQNIPHVAQKIMDNFWPGKITIVLKANENLPANLTAGSGKIGIRRPGHPVASALVKAVGGPVTGTSANISANPGCRVISELDPGIAESVDLIIDTGELEGGTGSTVIDVTEDPPVLIREGGISIKAVNKTLGIDLSQRNGEKTSAKLNETKIIHKGRVFSLARDKITLPNGVTTEIDIIRHPGASAMVPMLNKNTVLLIKQFRYAAGGFIWEIPAGTLNPGESPLECAKRELIEETGYSAGKFEKLTEIVPVPGYSDERIHIYIATGLVKAVQNLDRDEMLNVHEVKMEAALEMIAKGEIMDAKTISGLYLASIRL